MAAGSYRRPVRAKRQPRRVWESTTCGDGGGGGGGRAPGLAGPAYGVAEETVWLCEPGVQPNPCVGSLETTYVSSSGESRVETATNAPNPRVDCFYVYPTVSDQQGPNSTQ